MINLSDELLMAYVDGQLDKPQTSVVAQILRDDPDLAVRVSRLQQTQAQLLDTFGALLREGASAAARDKRARRGNAGAGFWLTAAAAALLVLLGAGAGLGGAYVTGMMKGPAKQGAQLPPTNWPGDIAEFHGFFTSDTMRVSPESQANPDMVKFQLSQAFEGMKLPDFTEQGMKLARGQMLNYRGNKVMQLAYLGKGQSLVALYISGGDGDADMSPGLFGDIKTVSWMRGEHRFVLAGTMAHGALQALAVIAQAQLGKK